MSVKTAANLEPRNDNCYDPWSWKVPGFHIYEGTVLGDSTPAEYLEDVKRMPLYEDDTFVISYPKAGTTMVQEIVWLVKNNGDVELANQTPTFVRVPFCDYIFPPDRNGILDAKAAERPRLLKTHLPFKIAPQEIMTKSVKIFYIMRNPKDLLVSYYYFYKSTITFGRFTGSWDEFFEMFKVENLYWGDIFHHILSWYQHKDKTDDVKYLFYEDIITNPQKNVRSICEFLNVNLSNDVMDKIVKATSFKTMKDNPATNGMDIPDQIDSSISPFMRKGTIGDWKNHFSEKQNQEMDEIIKRKLAGSGLKFIYEIGGEPR